MNAHAEVLARCGNRCEAEVYVPSLGVWTRCFRGGVEVHHALLRSRGGDLLDAVGAEHLVGLCRGCHSAAHSAGGGDLQMSGYVLPGESGPRYVGSDERLAHHTGKDS